MTKLVNWLKERLTTWRRRDSSPEALQELRAAFKARYHSFRLLLTSNNRALEIMTDLEKALDGNHPFGMSFVRSKSTAALVNVFRIVRHLDELAPGKYKDLFDCFKAIEGLINDALAQKRAPESDLLTVPFSEVDREMVDLVGGKMANVAELKNRLGLPAPDGFVITSAAYWRFMGHNDLKAEIDRRIQAADSESIDDLFKLSAGIQQLIIRASLPAELEQAVLDSYRELEKRTEPQLRVSMRSSAVGEDAAGTAFAGQFRSELNVSFDNILESYKQIVASKFGLPAITYRLARGIPDEEVPMCVGCMAMINAESGGVIYSCNPMNIRDASVLINSVWGLPKAVVDGSVEPDVFVVSRSPSMAIVRKEIRVKDRKFVCFPDEGVCRMDLTGDAVSLPSITDEHAFELASMAVALEEHYGTPQDIEWAVGPDGSIYLLQCRALQQWTSGDPRAAADSASPVDAPVLARGGTTASPGAASGPVYVVKTDSDKLRFVDGAVLVTVHSLPKWAPLLSRAAAVVTEVGGVAGHLANVAREFGAPALFGVPAAAERLTNGQIVTVDADGLTIYEGRVESLLTGQKSKKNLMAGSPVYRTLERIAALVTPLTLLDPESTTFRAKNCQTLHDITRFSHEKSVHEMFSFGRERRLAERASKQLVAEVAMQWWVIDLDDGFREGVEGKFVRLEEITSIPMHALWKGVVAFPWAGPPPVDTRGLMSVLMQAQTNPALDPAVQSPYSQRNYFMISKNFCSLSSRFGFHFSTVEALVGDRAQENYVSFAFKGGAADLVRRVKRAMLVASVLEEFDFRVEVTEDNASARFEGGDERLMKDKLAVLGYLIMHTRQLDMVMANDAAIAGYRAKFIEDIRSLV